MLDVNNEIAQTAAVTPGIRPVAPEHGNQFLRVHGSSVLVDEIAHKLIRLCAGKSNHFSLIYDGKISERFYFQIVFLLVEKKELFFLHAPLVERKAEHQDENKNGISKPGRAEAFQYSGCHERGGSSNFQKKSERGKRKHERGKEPGKEAHQHSVKTLPQNIKMEDATSYPDVSNVIPTVKPVQEPNIYQEIIDNWQETPETLPEEAPEPNPEDKN